MPPPNRRKGGWTLPGYEYLGPFNDVDGPEPTDELDTLAKIHDQQYEDLQKAGINPYTTYNYADQQMLEKTEQMDGIMPALVSAVWRTKRAITTGQQLGWGKPNTTDPQCRPHIKMNEDYYDHWIAIDDKIWNTLTQSSAPLDNQAWAIGYRRLYDNWEYLFMNTPNNNAALDMERTIIRHTSWYDMMLHNSSYAWHKRRLIQALAQRNPDSVPKFTTWCKCNNYKQRWWYNAHWRVPLNATDPFFEFTPTPPKPKPKPKPVPAPPTDTTAPEKPIQPEQPEEPAKKKPKTDQDTDSATPGTSTTQSTPMDEHPPLDTSGTAQNPPVEITNSATWTDNTITTCITRPFLCKPDPSLDEFHIWNPSKGQQTAYPLVITTNWRYIDFNETSPHFTSKDFWLLPQRAQAFRPKKITYTMENMRMWSHCQHTSGDHTANPFAPGCVQWCIRSQSELPYAHWGEYVTSSSYQSSSRSVITRIITVHKDCDYTEENFLHGTDSDHCYSDGDVPFRR